MKPGMRWEIIWSTVGIVVVIYEGCAALSVGFNASRDEAKEYADNNNISYRVLKEIKKSIKPKSYADNFAFDRVGSWTH